MDEMSNSVEYGSDEFDTVRTNTLNLIQKVPEKALERNMGPELMIQASVFIWFASDDLIDWDTAPDGAKDEFEDACKMACFTSMELAALEVANKPN